MALCRLESAFRFLRWAVLACSVLLSPGFGQTPQQAAIEVNARIVNENEEPIAGATIRVNPGDLRAVSDPAGVAHIELPAPGDYVIDAQHEGNYELRGYALHVDTSREITLQLATVREVFQSVNVSGSPSPTDVNQTGMERRLDATEINDVPYPSSHSIRNAMKLMPGVVQDSTGALHFDGSAEYQTLYLLNGFDIGDPVTGRFDSRMAVESVQSLDHWTGRYSPEYGRGSAGLLAIQTQTGTDAFHYTATNFIPGIISNDGLHLGGWTPRFGVSGPILKGRAWFSDDIDAEYDISFINGLPPGQNSSSGWSGSNLLHTQFNLTPSNILFADFLLNTANRNNQGLGALDPVSTTTTLRAREYFYSVKDQIYFSHGALFEIGFAQNRFSNRMIPQGTDLYVISPEGRSGNYFVNSYTTSRRDQLLADGYLPSFSFLGSHQLKIGADADRVNYDADIGRTGYEQVGLAGYVLSRTTFQGSGVFQRPNAELASYILDTWRIKPNLQFDLGVRQDWDELVRDVVLSPRFAVAYAPFGSSSTKISAGYAITYDATNLALFSRPLDQIAVTMPLNPDGSVAGPPLESIYVIPSSHLKMPRYQNWSASLNQRLPFRLQANISYLRRDGVNGFTYINPLAPTIPETLTGPDSGSFSGTFYLTNQRRDRYDAVQVILRQSLADQFEWMASYTRSHATSNAVLDLSIDQPMQVIDNYGPMPWDAPNRFLEWAYLPVKYVPLMRKNWAIAMLVDARTGFPFSAQNQYGVVVGGVDSYRYPFNFDLNLHLERRFTLRGYRFAIRGGFNNITNSRNPTAVNNVIGAPQFLQFYGYEGRHFVVRLRFFGRTT